MRKFMEAEVVELDLNATAYGKNYNGHEANSHVYKDGKKKEQFNKGAGGDLNPSNPALNPVINTDGYDGDDTDVVS